MVVVVSPRAVLPESCDPSSERALARETGSSEGDVAEDGLAGLFPRDGVTDRPG